MLRLSACLAVLLSATPALANVMNPAPDPYLWLEEVTSPRALDWVRAEDARSLAVLKADPHYQGFYDQALSLAQAQDRVPAPALIGGQVYNFWQDATHVRGLWRRTSLDDYRTAAPHWTSVLDLDALAASEHANWVWKGANCAEPAEHLCLISLSDGGEDATTVREFDLAKSAFVPGGFAIPHAKQVSDWQGEDTLLVGTDWGAGSMTASGYPFILKRLRRGQGLAQATEVFRGTPSDVDVAVTTLTDGAGHQVSIVQRELDSFHAQYFRLAGSGTEKLDLPEKAELEGLVADRLVVKLNQGWTPKSGGPLAAGSLISVDLGHAGALPVVLFAPGPRQSIEEVAPTAGRVVAAIYDNVRGGAVVFTPSGDGWTSRPLDLPRNVSVGVVSTTPRSEQAFLSVTGFLTPGSLYFADLASQAPPMLAKASPARFDASRDVVEQFEAESRDGTRIPYFLVHPKGMKADGSNPTLLYGYGGFQVSMLPSYSPSLGKLWLERGGVYALANIRGGGEFGPAWHDAALKTHRQRAYDDFAAVGQDLIRRGVTSPAKLGIRGGSNGGLLMGVEFEQHPELWHAVIIEVPLLDMLRFEHIAAGASWTGEYGSVANPDERRFLAGISPYQNLRAGVAYPEPFIFTTTKDDRVGPVHARKFAARMKAMGLPYLYYESIEGGHAAGANAREVAEQQALEMTYLSRKIFP